MSLFLDDTIFENEELIALLPELESSLARVFPSASLSLVLEEEWNCTRLGDEVTMTRPRTATGVLIRYYHEGKHKEVGTNSLGDLPRLIKDLCKLGSTTSGRQIPLVTKGEYTYPCQRRHEIMSTEETVTLLAGIANDLNKRPSVSLAKLEYRQEDRLQIFIGEGKYLKQRIPFTTLAITVFVNANGRTESQKTGARLPGGLEIIDRVSREDILDDVANKALALTRVEPLKAGRYQIVAAPEPASVIAHEAFGHGVEADMALRKLSTAANFMGARVGSELINLYDYPKAGPTSGFYYFDDEGVLAQNSTLIEKGILKGLISDDISARKLNISSTGNGRRVDYTRPVCSRMSCTYFDNGPHDKDELIESLDYGLYLTGNSSGQEDPLGWGMQVNAPLAYEIKKGKMTGRVFGPVVLTGYVPDILKSVDGVANDLAFRGLGKCGKTFWKDWVNVGMGSPTIRLSGRLA